MRCGPCNCRAEGCATTEFDCLDPAAGDELYDCKATPPATLPCSADVQGTWLVESSAQVRALAVAVNCSNGSFEVEWRGNIVVDEAIYIVHGTALTVLDAELATVVGGNGSRRLFTVVDATLQVSGVNITASTNAVGGAITGSGASIALNRTRLISNHAAGNGGAVYMVLACPAPVSHSSTTTPTSAVARGTSSRVFQQCRAVAHGSTIRRVSTGAA